MRSRYTCAILLTVLCFLLPPHTLASSRTVASSDTIPPNDWTYDAMISLAADGLVPGYAARVFTGDRLLDRMEMAGLVASVVKSCPDVALNARQTSLLDSLVAEFRPELRRLDPSALEDWEACSGDECSSSAPAGLVLGYVKPIAISDSEKDDEVLMPFRATGMLRLRDNAFACLTFAEKEEKFLHQMRQSTNLDKAFVRGFDSNFVWTVGRQYQNWGPSYSGSVILSANSPAFWQLSGSREVDFGSFIGRVKITQFASAFEDTGENLYLFGRRWEKNLSDQWFAGVSETAKTTFVPNPLIAVMPFYLYQHLFDSVDEEFNALYAADLTFRTKAGAKVYGELVIDDITAPRIFGDSFDRPRKIAYVVGAYTPRLFPGRRATTMRAEYILADPRTYEATRVNVPELAYIHDGEFIGTPVGRNSKALYVRCEHYFTDRFSVIGEYLNQRPKASVAPDDPSASVARRTISVQMSYDFALDRSLSLRIAPYRVAMPGLPAEEGTRYDLQATWAF